MYLSDVEKVLYIVGDIFQNITHDDFQSTQDDFQNTHEDFQS